MKPQRPPIMTFLCILGFVLCFLGIVLVFSPGVQEKGRIFAIYFSFSFAFLAVCLGGFWMMRKWAFWAYAVFFAVNQAVSLVFQIWNPQSLMPLIFLAIAAIYYRRMD